VDVPNRTKKPVILRRIAGLIILTLLCEKNMHGYNIWKKLERIFDMKVPHPIVYKILREYEEYGLVKSNWVHDNIGPARKMYSITEDGEELLRENLDFLKKMQAILADIVKFIEAKTKIDPN